MNEMVSNQEKKSKTVHEMAQGEEKNVAVSECICILVIRKKRNALITSST